jgi:hypothetical protein
MSEREALVQELEAALASQRAATAKRDRELAELRGRASGG